MNLAVSLILATTILAPAQPSSVTVGGGVVGTTGTYDYAPGVFQDGTKQNFIWCGGRAGTDPPNFSDTIKYQQDDFNGGVHVTVPEKTVLGETAGAWDSAFTCNPDAIKATTVDPANGNTYQYIMYYVGTNKGSGTDNSIGLAFSNDMQNWVKYPSPVIPSTTSGGFFYGVGQPNVYYAGGVYTLLYENVTSTGTSHIMATSIDGVNWTTLGTVSTAGLSDPQASWGGVAYSPADGKWYAAFNDALRDPATTGGVMERGQPAMTLYRISDPISGTWENLGNIGTMQTGYENNFLAGILRNPDGSVYSPLFPSIELYASTSVPRPAWNYTAAQAAGTAAFNNWDIHWNVWNPGAPKAKLVRAAHPGNSQHTATTGYLDPYYAVENINLGYLYESPQNGATVSLYACKQGNSNVFTAPDKSCRGQYMIGLLGYGFPAAGPGETTVYECTVPNVGDFLSLDKNCEGQQGDGVAVYTSTS